MKALVLAGVLAFVSHMASAAIIYNVTPTDVGYEQDIPHVYVGISPNAPQCYANGVYFKGSVHERNEIINMALEARKMGKTVRIDYNQQGGPGTQCYMYRLYVNP